MSPCRSTFAALFLLAPVLMPASAAPAQRPARPGEAAAVEEPRAPPGTIEMGKDGFVLPEGTIAVEELIDAAARFLARNILWQAQELGGQPSFVFQKRLALDAVGCEEMLGQLLATRNLAVVPVDEKRQVWEVLNLQGQRRGEVMNRALPRTVEEVLQRPNLKQVVLVTVPLKHINATVAQNALRPFFSNNVQFPTIQFGTAGTNEAILVLGFTDQVAASIRMLQQCDQPLQERNPDFYNFQQSLQNLQNAVTDLQTRLATAQKQIAELQKVSVDDKK